MNHIKPFLLFESNEYESMKEDIKDVLWDLIDEYDIDELEIENSPIYGIYYQFYVNDNGCVLSIYSFGKNRDKFIKMISKESDTNIYTFKSRLESMRYTVRMAIYTTCVDFSIYSN